MPWHPVPTRPLSVAPTPWDVCGCLMWRFWCGWARTTPSSHPEILLFHLAPPVMLGVEGFLRVTPASTHDFSLLSTAQPFRASSGSGLPEFKPCFIAVRPRARYLNSWPQFSCLQNGDNNTHGDARGLNELEYVGCLKQCLTCVGCCVLQSLGTLRGHS